MHQTYREFSLQAIRMTSIDVAAEIARHRQVIDKSSQAIDYYVTRLIFFWAILSSIAVAIMLGGLYGSWLVMFASLVFLGAVSWGLTRLNFIRGKVSLARRYIPLKEDMLKRQEDIEILSSKARDYQAHMEFQQGPGFLSCFEDVLLHPHFPSFYPLEDRERFVNLSNHGQGQDIPYYDYGKLLLELKACGTAAYTENRLVDKVAAQGKYSAAISYARLISQKNLKSTADEVCFAARVGLNAWLSYHRQGRPATWNVNEDAQWDLVKLILLHAEKKNIIGLAKSLAEFESLDKKIHKKKVV